MYKVMIVDDEPWVIARLRSICDWNKLGFQLVAERDNVAEAWEDIRRLEPQLVITDINMPGFSGLELMETAREMGVDAEFVVVSGYDEFAYAQKAISCGVFHYFLKPVDEGEFVSVLTKLRKKLDEKNPLEKQEAERELPPVTESGCLNSMIAYIHENYSQQFGLAELSGEFFVSQTYICDLFSKYLGTTFIRYLNGVRLEHAERLLERTHSPVSLVALESGFKDYSYFSRLFKKHYGMTPSEFRSRSGKAERK